MGKIRLESLARKSISSFQASDEDVKMRIYEDSQIHALAEETLPNKDRYSNARNLGDGNKREKQHEDTRVTRVQFFALLFLSTSNLFRICRQVSLALVKVNSMDQPSNGLTAPSMKTLHSSRSEVSIFPSCTQRIFLVRYHCQDCHESVQRGQDKLRLFAFPVQDSGH